MTRSQLITKVANDTNMTSAEVEKVMDGIFGTIGDVLKSGDKVTIAMPNCPQAIYMFYAVNLVGGIANMIHPLSAEKEIEFYLNASESVAVSVSPLPAAARS